MTLDELSDAFATALARERDGWWDAGEVVIRALRAADDADALYRHFASVGKCHAKTVRARAAVWAAFRTLEGDRHDSPEHSPTWHRAVLHAATRTGRNPRLLADEAIAAGWGQRELAALTGEAAAIETVRATATCPTCTATVRVRIRGTSPVKLTWGGKAIVCPVCAATKPDALPEIGRLG